MNRNFYVVDFFSLAQFKRLNFFKALTPESTSITISPDPLFLCLLFFSMFSYAFLMDTKRLKYPYWVLFLYSHTLVHLLLEECALKSKFVTKFNALHQNIHAHVALDNFRLNYSFKIFTISNIKRLNNKSFYHILLLLSGDIRLNPGPKKNLQPLDSNEWNVFKTKRLHPIHLNINSLLPKIVELRYIANSSYAAVIGISESTHNGSVLQSEIQINNYDLLRRDRNRNGGGVACYIRSDLSYI